MWYAINAGESLRGIKTKVAMTGVRGLSAQAAVMKQTTLPWILVRSKMCRPLRCFPIIKINLFDSLIEHYFSRGECGVVKILSVTLM